MQHLISTNNLTDIQIRNLIEDTMCFKRQRPAQLLKNILLITLFFEPSTRTRSSFEIAAKRLGASVVHLDSLNSSAKKGEGLEDTFANLCAMEPDGVIIRHKDNDAPVLLARMELTSVINAGAGNYAHPTQALLDLFTIYEHFDGEIEGKTIAIVGDIANSRVANSSIRLLTRMGLHVLLVAPKPFMPQKREFPQYEYLEEVIDSVDIIMSLRAQLERHTKPIFDNYATYANHYCITKERIRDRNILLLHPGPVMRNIDISDEMLKDPRCKVLTQVKNGVFMRMAILKLLLLDS
ncbi:MAG: aspartate carbamoyltransferase catalytic subunit [Sulfurovum sp.]|nr:aspartate carbamoyltransferase catalytic subunit [Sulfurovum sp.]MCB4745875.1 aspartate carbamoyltransferase catalytic subunit [Sulfurovum sp.]MCB4747569.1 aspartate carbamoyltransferase catalytic subunit [Sulfurovum sp.]MCB4749889.1 aspartate carbamoyltransferase catalytic subunit [Sulfurovum sp.]MCB4752771.1 aspartate carbamoyltransferase catalytic subunit [Sulfurovum sp.]